MRGSIPALLSVGVVDGQRVVLMDGRQAVEGRLEAGIAPDVARLMTGGATDRELCRRLLSMLEGPGCNEIRNRMGWLKNQAEAGKMPLRVMVDARSESLKNMPWEVLEAVEPRSFPQAQWVRVMQAISATATLAGFSRPPLPSVRRSVLEVVLWSPTPEEPAVSAALARLEAMVRGFNSTVCLRIPRDAGRLAPLPAAQVFRILHVVCSASIEMSKVEWAGIKPGILPPGLCPAPTGAGLVLLELVGPFGDGLSEEMGARWLSGGASACAVVRSRHSTESSLLFAKSLYGGLIHGLDLVDSLAEGRKSLKMAGGCWWAPMLMVAEPGVVQAAPPLRRLPLPGSWPAGTPEADELLDQAAEVASGYGFMGVEHFAAALVRHPHPGPLIALALPGLQLVAALLVPTESDGRMRLTPRMESIVRRLRDGFGVEDLVQQIVEVPWVAQILGASTMSRMRSVMLRSPPSPDDVTEQNQAAGPGLFFEVIGGPDDGRLLSLTESGQVLGRWDPAMGPPTILPGDMPNPLTEGLAAPSTDGARLFVGARVVERTVSRKHLVFVAPHSILAMGPTQLQRGENSKPVQGEVELRAGDRLLLGVGTRLLVVF